MSIHQYTSCMAAASLCTEWPILRCGPEMPYGLIWFGKRSYAGNFRPSRCRPIIKCVLCSQKTNWFLLAWVRLWLTAPSPSKSHLTIRAPLLPLHIFILMGQQCFCDDAVTDWVGEANHWHLSCPTLLWQPKFPLWLNRWKWGLRGTLRSGD